MYWTVFWVSHKDGYIPENYKRGPEHAWLNPSDCLATVWFHVYLSFLFGTLGYIFWENTKLERLEGKGGTPWTAQEDRGPEMGRKRPLGPAGWWPRGDEREGLVFGGGPFPFSSECDPRGASHWSSKRQRELGLPETTGISQKHFLL